MSDPSQHLPSAADEHAPAHAPPAVGPSQPPTAAAGAGRAQRSETERSDGERSGARPAPAAAVERSPHHEQARPPDVPPTRVHLDPSGDEAHDTCDADD